MRSHSAIVKAVGATRLATELGLSDAGPVHQWNRNDSIPAPYWAEIERLGHATLDELAAAAETKRRAAQAPQQSPQASAA